MRELKKQLTELSHVVEPQFKPRELSEGIVKPPTVVFEHSSAERLTLQQVEAIAAQAGFSTERVGRTIHCKHHENSNLRLTIAPHERGNATVVVHHLNNVEALTDDERRKILTLVKALPVRTNNAGALAWLKRKLKL